jgi:hypothetical protein
MKLKSILYSLALVATTFSATQAANTGTGRDNVQVVTLPENKVLVTAGLATTGTVTVELMDQLKNVLHSRKVKSVLSFSQAYNLKNMADGAYLIRVSNASFSFTVPVEITGGVATVKDNEVEEIQRPAVRLADRKLNVYSLLAGTPTVSVQLFNEDRRAVYTEQAQVLDTVLNRRYDLSQLPEGVYDLLITINGRVFSEEIAITR